MSARTWAWAALKDWENDPYARLRATPKCLDLSKGVWHDRVGGSESEMFFGSVKQALPSTLSESSVDISKSRSSTFSVDSYEGDVELPNRTTYNDIVKDLSRLHELHQLGFCRRRQFFRSPGSSESTELLQEYQGTPINQIKSLPHKTPPFRGKECASDYEGHVSSEEYELAEMKEKYMKQQKDENFCELWYSYSDTEGGPTRQKHSDKTSLKVSSHLSLENRSEESVPKTIRNITNDTKKVNPQERRHHQEVASRNVTSHRHEKKVKNKVK